MDFQHSPKEYSSKISAALSIYHKMKDREIRELLSKFTQKDSVYAGHLGVPLIKLNGHFFFGC